MYDRDALLAAVDLRALADDLLGPHAGSDRSPTWPCPNPGHAQTGRTPPVTIFDSHRGEPRWRCHGCGEGGTAIDLVIACRGGDVREALQVLADRAGGVLETPDWQPRRRAPSRALPEPRCSDPGGLTAYVESCERRLWTAEGRAALDWLTKQRGLSRDVLRTNHIGADLGPGHQGRPDGMCRASGVVLPVIARGEVVYAQLRVPYPQPDRPRYLNPTAALAPNPKLARFRPPEVRHPEVIVTEGAIDALSANAAGYRSVAVLSAGYPDRAVAHALSRLPHPLVIAFDPDDAGRAGAHRLAGLLDADLRPTSILALAHGDINEVLQRSESWSEELPALVRNAGTAPNVIDLDRARSLRR